jgi:hypothetical protein
LLLIYAMENPGHGSPPAAPATSKQSKQTRTQRSNNNEGKDRPQRSETLKPETQRVWLLELSGTPPAPPFFPAAAYML